MKITGIEAILVEEPHKTDAAMDAVLIRVTTDEGIDGIGEVNALPGAVAAAIRAGSYHSWSMGFSDLLIGEDPEHTDRLWDKMYRHTSLSGRRGLIPNIIAGIDVALWDIRGKAAGKPIHHLLGGARKDWMRAYLTIDPMPGADAAKVRAESLDMVAQGLDLGFTAFKQETSAEQAVAERDVIETVAKSREMIGDDATLMLDVVYRWHDLKTALGTITAIRDADLFFVEAPFSNDRVDDYARLAAATPTRIAAGEWSITRFECYDYIDRGLIDVIQPGVCRVGGFTEALRVARHAADKGRMIVPYGWWATNIGLMTSLHLAAVCDHCPLVEFVHPAIYPSAIRNELVRTATTIANGGFTLPTAPGLGVEIDEDALRTYRIG
jgi:L-rhamnonate dehydratase